MRKRPPRCGWWFFFLVLQAARGVAPAQDRLATPTATLEPGDVLQLKIFKDGEIGTFHWISSDPLTAAVYGKGYVCAIHPGGAKISAGSTTFLVTVTEPKESLTPIAAIQQYPDNRMFRIKGRKCYGSELNGQRASDPDEKKNTEGNRIINPHPLSDKNLEWQLADGAEVYDGAGVLMGSVAPRRDVSGKKVPVSMFNFGMSKVLHDQICVYGFSVTIEPSPELLKVVDVATKKSGTVSTSAWIPLERVIDKDDLLDRIGLGKVNLPRLPLGVTTYTITGGNPEAYMTESAGELAIVKELDGPVPSHYLRRPSGTVNVMYSVPGFGLGGQSLDSFLVTDGVVFHQAKGAKVFVQPTYFPKGHPQAGKVSPRTMTFLYGAVEAHGCEPIYGWIAKEALAPEKP